MTPIAGTRCGRTRALGVWTLLSVCAAACAGTPSGRTSSSSPAHRAQEREAKAPPKSATLSACAGCHDASGARPPALATLEGLPRIDAYRAAMMVAARRMPPPPSPLSDDERSAIVDELCTSGGPRDACPALSTAKIYVAHPRTLLNLAQDEVPRDGGTYALSSLDGSFPIERLPSQGTPAEEALLAYQKDGVVSRLDMQYVTLSALLAAERCGRVADGGAFERCAARLIDNPRSRIPK